MNSPSFPLTVVKWWDLLLTFREIAVIFKRYRDRLTGPRETAWALVMALGEDVLCLLRYDDRPTGVSDTALTATGMHRCQRVGQRDLPSLLERQRLGSSLLGTQRQNLLFLGNLSGRWWKLVFTQPRHFHRTTGVSVKKSDLLPKQVSGRLWEEAYSHLTFNSGTSSRKILSSLPFIGSLNFLSACCHHRTLS